MTNATGGAILARYTAYEAGRAPPAVYTHPGSLDAWRHRWVRDLIAPLVDGDPSATWLTLGDGYFGADAHHLKRRGRRATASALAESCLAQAAQEGWIDDWRVENVERMDCADGQFDYVFCAETLQHCTRPWHGFHEMMRVARKGCAVMTCIDRRGRPLDALRDWLRRLLRGARCDDVERYAHTGDVLYRLSTHEFVKAAAALQVHAVAWREFTPVAAGRHWDRPAVIGEPAYLIMRTAIRAFDWLTKLRMLSPSNSWVLVFKVPPPAGVLANLAEAGFRIQCFRGSS